MRSDRGNILFLILLAIILFAALTYAVNSGMRGGGSDSSKERVQTQASAILNFLDQVSLATTRMTMTGGIKPGELSFGYTYRLFDDSSFTGFSNSGCTVDTCRVFRPSGGGVSPQTFESYANMSSTGLNSSAPMPGYFQVIMLQFPYAGTSLNDVVIRLMYIKKEICDEIAARLSLPTNTTIAGTYLSVTGNWDDPGYTVSSSFEPYIGQNTMVTYHGGTGTGQYCFINRVLIAR